MHPIDSNQIAALHRAASNDDARRIREIRSLRHGAARRPARQAVGRGLMAIGARLAAEGAVPQPRGSG